MEVKLLPFTYNVPFFSIFLALLSAVSVPFLKKGEQALRMIRVVQAVVAALSAALLAHLWSGDSFTFMMGHFPAPWGNELRAGPLEALLALAFSLVMFLSLTGGAGHPPGHSGGAPGAVLPVDATSLCGSAGHGLYQ